MPKVTIYSQSYCPYCVKAKILLKRKNIEFEEIMISDDKTREEMIERSGGRMTVPQIFIAEKHVGGCDDLYDLEAKNLLDAMLQS